MDTVRYEHRDLDVVCELEEADVGSRVEEWRGLREQALASESIAGGARLWLRAEAWAQADDLTRREAACCGFLDIELAFEGERVRLDVTSDAPGTAPLIAGLLGPESQCSCPCC